ncbi:MAG: hypothetical protein Q9221_000023 [Calogaya cf. arnoldii]
MQLAEEDEVDYDDLYGIPERMHHNRTVSRVLDTPNDRLKGHSSNSFPHVYEESEQSSNSDYAGNESYLQIPQSPLDPTTMNPSASRTLPETFANTTMALLSEDCSHVSQSVLDDVVATQRLPAPDPSQHYMRLSRETARRLEERGAPAWVASDDEDHVGCHCKFNEREGRMVQCRYCNNWQHDHCYGYISSVLPDDHAHACYRCLFAQDDIAKLRQLEDLALGRRCLWMLYGSNPPSTQAELKRRLQVNDRGTVAKLVHRLKEEGFLQPASRVEGNKLIRSDSPAQAEKRQRLYGNPMSLVVHCYERTKVCTSHR